MTDSAWRAGLIAAIALKAAAAGDRHGSARAVGVACRGPSATRGPDTRA